MDPTLHYKRMGHPLTRAGTGRAAQKQTIVNIGPEHRDGCAKLIETIDRWMTWALLTREEEKHSNGKMQREILCEHWLLASLGENLEGTHGMRDDRESWYLQYVRTRQWLYTSRWWSLRHSGLVEMQLTKLGRTESFRKESIGRRAFSVFVERYFRVLLTSLASKLQSSWEEECWNSPLLSTMTRHSARCTCIHSCLQSLSPDQVYHLFLSSDTDARSAWMAQENDPRHVTQCHVILSLFIKYFSFLSFVLF